MRRITLLMICLALAACARAPDFVLTDQNGHAFHFSQVRGKAAAVFFGYTHCTDVCPTTLMRLAQAKRLLGADASRVAVLFITVDPGRDVPSRLKIFVHTFDPAFVGLTGTQAQLKPVYKAFHVWLQRLPSRDRNNYEMAHTSSITFLYPNGAWSGVGDWTDQPPALAADFRKALRGGLSL